MTITRLACLILVLFPIWLFSQSSSQPMEELSLKNGMKICLQPTSYEKGEAVFELFAMGGYAGLAKEDKPSAIIAPEIVKKSGLGDHTGDALIFNLYQKEIELDVKIQAFDRLIEGHSPSDALEKCFQTITLFFTCPKFDPHTLQPVISKISDSLKGKNETELNIDEIFIKLNTHDWEALSPLRVIDLGVASVSKAEQLFKQFFSTPADFTFVLVGDFEIKTIQPLLEKTLGSIPIKTSSNPKNPPLPAFPAGITKIEKFGFQRCYNKQSITRLTFPILTKIEGTNDLNLICQVIKYRLRPLLPETDLYGKRLKVSYEFPFFPRLDTAWLTIQFYSQPSEIDTTSALILDALRKLQNEGVSEAEIERLQCTLEEKMKIEENSYLLSLLSNYYRANWPISYLYQKENAKKLEKEVIKNRLKSYLKLDQYSFISLHP